jgi:hypothetical protein
MEGIMAQTKKIDQGRWPEYLSMLSNGNRGRTITIEMADMAIGDQPLSDAAPLFAIDFDPAGKGNDLVLTTGRDEVDYTHTIGHPAEIWESQDDNGKVLALEIINQSGSKTILTFKS